MLNLTHGPILLRRPIHPPDSDGDDSTYWRCDEFMGEVYWEKWTLAESTPKGAWYHYEDRSTWRTASTRFIHPTREGALRSYLARKQAHLKHIARCKASVERNMELAEEALELVLSSSTNSAGRVCNGQ